jgi:hypothetical protein
MRNINTVEAATGQQKYYAWLNARSTSIANKSHFSTSAQLQMERVQVMLNMLHYNSAIEEVNYRKTLAAVKVKNRNVSNKKQHKEYIAHLEELGFVVKSSAQGLNYTIKKDILEKIA